MMSWRSTFVAITVRGVFVVAADEFRLQRLQRRLLLRVVPFLGFVRCIEAMSCKPQEVSRMEVVKLVQKDVESVSCMVSKSLQHSWPGSTSGNTYEASFSSVSQIRV